MSSCSRRCDNLPFFSSKKPYFLNLILEDTIQAGKLAIPTRFVKRCGSTLRNLVFLRVPTGAIWPIEVSKHKGVVWLCGGWRAFAEFYSLEYGCSLVFEHNGCNQFNVFVFDITATEIWYPYCIEKHQREGVFEKETSMNYKSVEILDDYAACQKTRNDLTRQKEIISTPVSLSRKRKNGRRFGEKGGLGKSTGRVESKSGDMEKMKLSRLWGKRDAFLRDRGFQSENPYFAASMSPFHINSNASKLNIPNPFARKHMGKNRSDVTLCVSDGRTWLTRYHCYPHLQTLSSAICVGWKKFVNENNLRVGDICVFELINNCDIKLKVSTFRVG